MFAMRCSLAVLVPLLLLVPYAVASEDIRAVTNDGKSVILHDDGTWEDVGHDESLDLQDQIEITILEAKVVETYRGNTPGYRLKIKNNSAIPIYELKIRLLFIDKKGKPFFEEERTPVDSKVLKPNYSFLYPKAGSYCTVDTLDMTEWDEGNIKIEIIEIKTEPP